MIRWLRRPIVWVPVSIALVALIVWRSRAWEVGAVLGVPDVGLLVAAVGLNAVVLVCWAVRSHDLLAGAGHRVGIPTLVPMTAFANTINNLTPGSAGELIRLWLLRLRHGVPYVTGGGVILIERVIAIGYLGASAAIVFVGHLADLQGWVVTAALIVLAALPGILYRVGLRPAGGLAHLPFERLVGAPRWARFGTRLAALDTTVAALLTNPRRAAVFATTTALLFACYALQLTLVAASIRVPLGPVDAWGALGLSIMAGVISMIPFGLGAADLVLVALLGVLGVDPRAAAGIAFGYRVVSTLPLGLVGIGSYVVLSAQLPDHSATAAMAAARRDLEAEGTPP